MARVYLSLGSNIRRHLHISAALAALTREFGELTISSVYESEAVGFAGSDFFNLVVGVETTLDIAALSSVLKKIEDANGRNRQGPRFSPRTLDIDILTYDDFVGTEAGVTLPREEITQNAFVLLPLAELAPDTLHPQLGQSYSQLWQAYDKSRQQLWPVQFIWQDRLISEGRQPRSE